MNSNDYINSVIGKPYKQGADGPNEFDCWGIIPHSFHHVEGIELPTIPNRAECDLDGSARADGMSDWQECKAANADIFCCYDAKERMVHIGRVFWPHHLHAAGDLTRGQVAIWTAVMVRRIYKNVRYFKLCQ